MISQYKNVFFELANISKAKFIYNLHKIYYLQYTDWIYITRGMRNNKPLLSKTSVLIISGIKCRFRRQVLSRHHSTKLTWYNNLILPFLLFGVQWITNVKGL